MFSFFKKKPKVEKSPVERFAEVWEVRDIIEGEYLGDKTLNGLPIKETAKEFYAGDAPYEVMGRPYIPTARHNGINVLMFMDFLVLEVKSGKPDCCFYDITCRTQDPAISLPIMKYFLQESEKSEEAVVNFIVAFVHTQKESIEKRFGPLSLDRVLQQT